MFVAHLDKTARLRFAGTLLTAAALYVSGFLALYFTVGFGSSIFAIIPAAIIAWSYGCRAGILAGLLAGPLNIGMYALLEENWYAKGFVTGTIFVARPPSPTSGSPEPSGI